MILSNRMEIFAALLTTLFTLLFLWHASRCALNRAREEAGELVLRLRRPAEGVQKATMLIVWGLVFAFWTGTLVVTTVPFEGVMLLNWVVFTFNMGMTVLALNFGMEVRSRGLLRSQGIHARLIAWDRVKYCKWTFGKSNLFLQLATENLTHPVAEDQREAAAEALGRFAEIRGSDGGVIAAPPAREYQPDKADWSQPSVALYRFQFSLQTLLLFMLTASSAFAWFGIYWRRHEQQAAVLEALAEFQPQVTRIMGIVWLDFSASPVKPGDRALAEIARLDRLASLNLQGCPITDAGLAELDGLPRLTHVYLGQTPVTDVGLEHLKTLPALKHVSLWSTRGTDTGVRDFQAALPEVDIHR